MGWLGSALACSLNARGIPFTWSDIDSDTVAWRASNGVISPDGDDRSERNRIFWRDWYESGMFPDGTIARASYVYSHKQPPHAGKYDVVDLPHGLHLAATDVFVANVADIVVATRQTHQSRRTSAPPVGSYVIEAHGYTRRLDRVTWGWTANATLTLPDYLADLPNLALYGRPNRFEVVFVTTRPGHPHQYRVGVSTIPQATPVRRPDVALVALAKRIRQISELFPGVTVDSAETPIEGWRPRARNGQDRAIQLHGKRGCTLPPLLHSGIRWSPEIVNEAAALAEAITR